MTDPPVVSRRTQWILAGVVGVVGFGMLALLVIRDLQAPPQGVRAVSLLLRELDYLRTEVPELAWMEVDGNNVYLGFRFDIPDDWRLIVNGAALSGNRATDFGVHVWATQAREGWRPGDRGVLCQATARDGHLEQGC